MNLNNTLLQDYFKRLAVPDKNSHKGQNGKLLLIGGSELFHAASKWSLDVASKIVDMVFYSSVSSNNQLLLQAKSEFWNGIVIERESLESYVDEADCILIGPGMERTQETRELVNKLLVAYPDKKWVIDAGALQMVAVELLNKNHIITPHYQELLGLYERLKSETNAQGEVTSADGGYNFTDFYQNPQNEDEGKIAINLSVIKGMSKVLGGATLIIKGRLDFVGNEHESVVVAGGNAGMTKGGTGDVLAGLVAGLYCKNTALVAAVVGSSVNKQAGDELYKTVGPFFNASDLVQKVPEVLWSHFSLQNLQ